MENEITFIAEVRELKVRKLISNDKEITVMLNTCDRYPEIFKLLEVSADQTVEVTVKW